MQFLYQPLTWGFLLIGVPILVHLINMLRHRRVKWAAMDFLLESNRRNRRWVMLKQWLLLASRILAMLLLVMMLARWISNSQWMGLLGGQTTHHYLLLDDSYSMNESESGESAYSRALRSLDAIVRSIAGRGGQHQVTLVRFSRAALAARNESQEARLDAAADLFARSIPAEPGRLLERLNATRPTALQLSPDDALDLVAPMITQHTEEKANVYVVTDLRRNEYGEPESTKSKLRELADSDVSFQFIDCGKNSPAQNLSIATVEPEQEVWAAGVPLMVRIQVRNQSPQTARNVVIRLRTISYPEGLATPRPDEVYSGDVSDLPPVVIEQIEPSQTVARQVQVIFSTQGQHVVEASLPDDALADDNRRWCVIGIQQTQRVLLVDGEVDNSNAFFFETAVRPDARLRTGISVERGSPTKLRDSTFEAIEQFDVVCLLDVPRLEPQAIALLEDYCRAGHGLFFLGGRNTNLQFMNEQLYRDGQGLFPLQLEGIVELDSAELSRGPNVTATSHPVLAPLTQLSSSPFFLLQIRRLFETSSMSPQDTGGLDILAYGPGNRPLFVERRFGNGRVLALLTGLTSDWSNWAQDPTFVVVVLRTLGYLGSFRREATSEPVGQPTTMLVQGQTIMPDAEVLVPATEQGTRLRLQRKVEQLPSESTSQPMALLQVRPTLEEPDRQLLDPLLRQGIFESWMTTSQGKQIVRNAARNVVATEGNLERVTRNEFDQRFEGLPVEYRTADAVSGSGMNTLDASHSTLMMLLLAALLVAEQLLAYSASYHSPRLIGAAH
ncbi:MAG: BatA domain-containing protein [Planctomycetales bacterium]|nr:BatA domain-containing protein [Planctomycetales bacterium]